MKTEMLNVVNEQGEVIGTESREKIHREGLLHREINIWLYTPRGELIFQHRAHDKDTNPDLLDASAGGHVDVGMDFLDTATKELEEETGIHALPQDLEFIKQVHSNQYDPLTGMRNNALQNVYAYPFEGEGKSLRVEPGKGAGFEVWPIKNLYKLSPEQARRFIFPLVNFDYLDIFRQIEELQKEGANQ